MTHQNVLVPPWLRCDEPRRAMPPDTKILPSETHAARSARGDGIGCISTQKLLIGS